MANELIELGAMPPRFLKPHYRLGTVENLLDIVMPRSWLAVFKLTPAQATLVRPAVASGAAGLVSLILSAIPFMPRVAVWPLRLLGFAGLGYGVYKFAKFMSYSPEEAEQEAIELRKDIELTAYELAQRLEPLVLEVEVNNPYAILPHNYHELERIVVYSESDYEFVRNVAQRAQLVIDAYDWSEDDKAYVQNLEPETPYLGRNLARIRMSFGKQAWML